MSTLMLPNGSGQMGREITGDYNEINYLELDTIKQAKLEMWIAKNMGDTLIKHYPNRQWGVRVDINGGVIVLSCDSISYEKGYYIHMERRNIHELQERVKMAAGEILERHNVSRARKFDADILETLPRDHRDNVIVDSGDVDAKI